MQNIDFTLDRPLVFFDIESTGTSPRMDRIIELAAIRLSPDGSEETKTWRVNPGVPIPPDSTEVHGITDAQVKDCPPFAAIAGEVEEFFAGADVAGYNSERFDIPILQEEFLRCDKSFDMAGRRSIDVQKIFFKREPRDLSAALRFYCGREHAGAHGAQADARATLDVFRGQLQRYADLPRTVAGLEDAVTPPDPLNVDRQGMLRWVHGELCVNFGRRKGTPVHELLKNDRNYLKWIVNGDFPVETRLVCKRLLDNGVLPDPPPEARRQTPAHKDSARRDARQARRDNPRPPVFNATLADAFKDISAFKPREGQTPAAGK